MPEVDSELKQVVEVAVPLDDIVAVDASQAYLEKRARGFILGTESHTKRKEIREQLEQKVEQKIGKKGKYLTDKLFELIEGVYLVDKRGGKDGRSVRYYQVPPNLQAIVYALDRVLGKPKQQVESTEKKEGIIVVEHIIRNLAGDKSAGQPVLPPEVQAPS